LGCGARDEKKNLIRLAVTNERELIFDDHRGRGGYLHERPACWQAFLGRKGHYRAFRVEISREQKEQLIRRLKSRAQE
jgi:predicted RNA-binding protein YlxR (DUF448 family)